MIARRIIAVAIALLVGAQVVRNAAVAAFAERKPAIAAAFWPGHPSTEISLAMMQIAEAARSRRPVPATAFSLMDDAAAKAPLAPDPFLVRGVQAELAGDGQTAQRAFEAAQWRDPRSLPAAYFLADRYFRINDPEHGLREVAALMRLSPHGPETVGPYLANYARDPANWPALRKMFRADPRMFEPTLVALSSNIETVPAALALADPRETVTTALWLGPLVGTLTAAGRYDQGRSIWARVSRARMAPEQLLYDPSFSDRTSPPPFNWNLTSSTVGIAERQPGGRLHVVFYGQEDGFLATQLLVLPRGSYRLSLQLLGDPARAHNLNWSIWCDKAGEAISSITLDAAAARGWRFEVPTGCGAQWLRLSGTSGEVSQQTDVTIAALKLVKEPSDA